MWIESESGNLINSDAVREIVIVGPYDIDDDLTGLYDLYCFNIGEVFTIHETAEGALVRGQVFRDAHRYLIQHARSHEECRRVLERLKEALRNGSRYFDARAVHDRLRRLEDRRLAGIEANGRKPARKPE
jgi:hypothetical protein